ncbi:MAG: hypothetical protein D6758_08435 [Gammaproteobacteria bacterium]|nr:MAG: hypothetical protein D6758_08435 [Gammaproteobacteria bacterium]
MKKLIFWPLFLAVVLFGAFKLFVWLTVQEQINALKRDMALTAALDTGWVESELDGTIRIRDVRITPYRWRNTLSLDAVTLKFPSAWALITLGSNLEKGWLPDSLQIELSGGEVPVKVVPGSTEDLPVTPLDTLFFPRPCGDIRRVDAAALLEMGYGVLTFEARMGWTFDRFDRLLKIDVESLMDGVQRAHLTADLQLFHDLVIPPPAASKPPRIIHLELDLADLGFEKRLNRLCGGKTGLDESELLVRAQQNVARAAGSLGLELGAGWLDASRQWMLGDADLRIALNPVPDFEYNMITLMSAESVLDALGFRMTLNGKPYAGLTLRANTEQLARALTQSESAAEAAPPEPEPESPSQVPPEPVRQWLEVDPGELEVYLDLPARVTLHSGKVLEGRLTRVEPYSLELARQVAKGEVGYTIKKVEIKTVEIYTRSQP